VITQKVSAIDTEDYFQVLGVDREADRVAIKNAYIAAARMYHPDRLGVLGTSSLRGDAERIFRRVSEAYATVSDDNRRGAYLAQLQRPATQKQVEVDAQRVVAGEMAFMEGEVAWKRRDYRTAIDRLEDAVRMNPSEGEAVGLLAYVRVIAGHASLAELRSEFERAVQLSPRSARCYYYLGLVIKDAGDLGNALKAFKRAVDIDPHLAAAHSEIRVLTMRNAKSGPQDGVRGLFDRLRKK
jgi:curved DNA-binding protein CbpA